MSAKIGFASLSLPYIFAWLLLPPHIENHLHLSADFHAFQQRAVRVLRRHPEALSDWLTEFAPQPAPKLIEAAADD